MPGLDGLRALAVVVVVAFHLAPATFPGGYVGVDAFFVLAFGSTFLPGAIVAFLVFGPMIDVKMLALMRTTFTTRILVIVTAVVGLSSAALGLAVNYAV